jgi:hypothetical protein
MCSREKREKALFFPGILWFSPVFFGTLNAHNSVVGNGVLAHPVALAKPRLLPEERPMSTLAELVPVRHGTARLEVVISGQRYRVNRGSPNKYEKRSKVWNLTEIGGERPGTTHSICKHRGITCSCEDSTYKGAICKHARALVAVGLLSHHGSPFAGPAARHLVSAPTALVTLPAPSSEGTTHVLAR